MRRTRARKRAGRGTMWCVRVRACACGAARAVQFAWCARAVRCVRCGRCGRCGGVVRVVCACDGVHAVRPVCSVRAARACVFMLVVRVLRACGRMQEAVQNAPKPGHSFRQLGGIATILENPRVDLVTGTRVIHRARGAGRVVAVDFTEERGKPFEIAFDSGEVHRSVFLRPCAFLCADDASCE